MKTGTKSFLRAEELRQWTTVSPYRNLLCVASDYACLFVIHLVNFMLIWNHSGFTFAKWAVIPFGLFTILMTGCLMHRIGLLGHEASHGLLFPNRKWNEILSDVLCFYPLWSSTDSYRLKHTGHHLHPNDPEKDPNMAGDKTEELYARFPMPRPEFIWNYYAKFFWPPFVMGNLLDLFRMLTMGRVPGGKQQDSNESEPKATFLAKAGRMLISPTTLGVIYLIGFIITTRKLIAMGDLKQVLIGELIFIAIGVIGWKLLPENRFRKAQRKPVLPPKKRALFRMLFYTATLMGIAWARALTGFHWGAYYLIFWVFPLIYIFPYLMLLREIYQHANLGTGKLDNSRIIHADPFTRWALLGYGNDFHLIHHIYPNIPHYHLRATHARLLEVSEEYRQNVIETRGTFHAPEGDVTLLQSLESSQRS